MDRPLYRFDVAGSVLDWSAIDDRVMGGVSRSRLYFDAAGHGVFAGVVSLERSGGFASIRSRPAELGLSGATFCVVEVRGDGHHYKLALHDEDGFDRISHQIALAPSAGVWTTIRLPLADFRPTFRGRLVAEAPPLDPARIRQVGLMIAGRQAGPFSLDVRSIGLEQSAFASEPPVGGSL